MASSLKDANVGDQLRNKLCHDYLLKFKTKLEALPTRTFPEGSPLVQLFENYTNTYFNSDADNSALDYGNFYTRFLATIEDNIEDLGQSREANEFVELLYKNPSQLLETTYDEISNLIANHRATDGELEHAIAEAMKRGSQTVNTLAPQDAESTMSRLNSVFGSHYKPQHTTSIASTRTYKYKSTDSNLPQELRFGTQAQAHDGNIRVSPLFERWLARSAEAPPSAAAQPARITHVYVNNLGLDRNDLQGTRERNFTLALHGLEDRHPNAAVITLPADKGIFSRKLPGQQGSIDSQRVKDMFLTMASRSPDTGPTIPEIKGDVKDLYISDAIKQRLYGPGRNTSENYDTEQEEATLKALITASLEAMGLSGKAQLSHAEVQAAYFHFIKFGLTNHILKTLQPETFNISCKDAIDRGGVSSAFYNLMKSIDVGQPMSEAEFNQALQAAPTMVKGRGMNHHADLIWNAVNVYVDHNKDKLAEQNISWLKEWRDKNRPLKVLKQQLNETFVAHEQTLAMASTKVGLEPTQQNLLQAQKAMVKQLKALPIANVQQMESVKKVLTQLGQLQRVVLNKEPANQAWTELNKAAKTCFNHYPQNLAAKLYRGLATIAGALKLTSFQHNFQTKAERADLNAIEQKRGQFEDKFKSFKDTYNARVQAVGERPANTIDDTAVMEEPRASGPTR